MIDPMDYADIFRVANKSLGQVNTGENTIATGVSQMENAFVAEYQKRTGKPPTEDQVRSFLASTVTPQYASGVILGTIGNPQIKASTVPGYFQANPDLGSNGDQGDELLKQVSKRTEAALQKRLDELYGRAYDSGAARIDENYGAARGRAISEEAALGRLRSPASAASSSPLGVLDKGRLDSLGQLSGNIAGQQAAGQLDVSKALEGLFANERQMKQQGQQFGAELGLKRDALGQSSYEDMLNRLFSADEAQKNRNFARDRAEDAKPGAWERAGQAADIFSRTTSGLQNLFGRGGGKGIF